mgnify:CR=1 FL=1
MLKRVMYITAGAFLGIFLVTLSFWAAHKTLTELPQLQDIQSSRNITEHLPLDERNALLAPLVHILSLKGDIMF